MVIAELRRAGVRALRPTGWEDYDTQLLGSALVVGNLVSSSHPVGFVQLRVRPRLRAWRIAALLGAAGALLGLGELAPAAAIVALGAGEVARGLWRVGPLVSRVVHRSALAEVIDLCAAPDQWLPAVAPLRAAAAMDFADKT